MTHELDTNAQTGRLAYFGVKLGAWHKEGFTVPEPPTMAEAMRLGGMDYDVMLRPLKVTMPSGVEVMSHTGKATVRMDRETVLGIVGDDYRPINNRDAFQVAEPLIDSGVATIETGGTLRGGADAWLLLRFNVADPVVQEVFAGDIIPFATIVTNHTGRRKVIVMETPVRIVCANTLGQALGNHGTAVAVSHRGDKGTARVIEAAQRMFAGITERYRSIAEGYAALKSRVLSVEEFTKTVLDVAAPLPDDKDAPRFKGTLQRAEERRSAIERAWTHGKGHVADSSAWEAYNGAVEVIDHDDELYRVRGSRLASMLDGRMGELKSQVLSGLLELAK